MARFNKFPLISMLALGAALPAFAQAQPAQPAPQTAPPAEEERTSNVVVVTANKRQESVQDVAVAVTAITAEKKEEQGIISVGDLTNVTPGLNYTPADERVTLRGVGKQTASYGADPGVANYNDNIYTAFAIFAGKDPILIERVEVLRGPQGTLYGRNSIGGAINTISKRPTDEFKVDVTAGMGDYDARKVGVAVSGPITDDIRYRFAGFREQREGIDYNYGTTKTEGWEIDDTYLEAQLEGDIGDRWSWWFKTVEATYDKAGPPGGRTATFSTAPFLVGGQFSVATSLSPIASYAFSGNSAIVGFDQIGSRRDNPFATNRETSYNVNTPTTARLPSYDEYILENVYEFDSFDLKVVSGYTYYDYRLDQDIDGTSVNSLTYRAVGPSIAACNPLVGTPITGNSGLGISAATVAGCAGINTVNKTVSTNQVNNYKESRSFFSNEVNLISTDDSALKWILGLYQYQENNDQIGTNVKLLGEPGVQGNFQTDSGALFPSNGSLYKIRGGSIQHSWGGFARGDYDITDQIRLTAAVRYSLDIKKFKEEGFYSCFVVCRTFAANIPGGLSSFTEDYVAITPLGFSGTGVTYDADTTARRTLKNSWSMVTGDLGVEYRPGSDTLIFAKFSKGYKAGGMNLGFAPTTNTNAEKAYVYEAGWKQTWDDLFLTTNAGIFFYDYRDAQASVNRVLNQGIPGQERTVLELRNLPKAESKGFELETNWNPIDDLNIAFTYSYLMTEVLDGGGITTNPARDGRSAVVGGVIVYNDPTSQVFLEGKELPQAPNNKVAVNASYKFNFQDGSSLLPSVSYYWRDKFYTSIFNDPLDQTPTQSQADARLTWRSADNHFTIIGWARNVFDDDGYTTVAANSFRTADSATYQTFSYTPPRTLGIDVQFHY